MEGQVVGVCAFPREVAGMRKAFPNAKIIMNGEAMTGTAVTAYIVSPHVNVLSDWFRNIARLRLVHGCEDNVFRLYKV